MNEMRPLLLELYARYPKARLSDYIKLLQRTRQDTLCCSGNWKRPVPVSI